MCQDEESTLPISSVFSDAFNDGSAPAHFRLLDCNYVLPSSGKSIVDRFNLDLKIRPTVFVSGAGVEGGPQQIPAKALKTGDMLVKALKAKLEKRAAKIETTQDLRTKCLDKEVCGLLLKGTKKAPKFLVEAMQQLLKEFPDVAFAAINSNVLYVKNLEEYLPELQGEEPRFVVFKKVSGSSKTDGDRLKTSIVPLEVNVSYGTMSNLVASVIRKTVTPIKIAALPSVKTRTKKLVQEEKAKRERRAEQQKRQEEKKQQQQSDSATANDGSKEGRRLERERRRAEHRKENMVREKTPEELAEQERGRRERMEQEAANWNVAPEDAPPSGEYLYEDEGDTDFDGDEEVDEDEDVIDLD